MDLYREFPEFVPYWVDPDGLVIKAIPGHIKWGQTRFNLAEGQPVMSIMAAKGWLRMIVRHHEVWIDTYWAKPSQMKSVADFCIENRKMLYDEKTQRQVDV